ncbi:MAG: methyltransferase domain-containing protein [Armatimonadetes bacterium]|nr:methyltransferase domain-containing protein [Armatimonadota bacterium]
MSLLHIAPEQCFSDHLRLIPDLTYLAGDLAEKPAIDFRMDLCDIPMQTEHLDGILCLHVLEHIPDDAKAMSEMYRVLKNGGWAVVMVPTDGQRTIEALDAYTPAQRIRLFGQADHVRQYGSDILERLSRVGFEVAVIRPEQWLDATTIRTYGLSGEIIHRCTKRSST